MPATWGINNNIMSQLRDQIYTLTRYGEMWSIMTSRQNTSELTLVLNPKYHSLTYAILSAAHLTLYEKVDCTPPSLDWHFLLHTHTCTTLNVMNKCNAEVPHQGVVTHMCTVLTPATGIKI